MMPSSSGPDSTRTGVKLWHMKTSCQDEGVMPTGECVARLSSEWAVTRWSLWCLWLPIRSLPIALKKRCSIQNLKDAPLQ